MKKSVLWSLLLFIGCQSFSTQNSQTFMDLLYQSPEKISLTLQDQGWNLQKEKDWYDMIIRTWERDGATLVLEYGEGYDNSLIYQTEDKKTYSQMVSSFDGKIIKEYYNDISDTHSVKAFSVEYSREMIIMIAEPLEGKEVPFVVIFTTIGNIDALYFDGPYF